MGNCALLVTTATGSSILARNLTAKLLLQLCGDDELLAFSDSFNARRGGLAHSLLLATCFLPIKKIDSGNINCPCNKECNLKGKYFHELLIVHVTKSATARSFSWVIDFSCDKECNWKVSLLMSYKLFVWQRVKIKGSSHELSIVRMTMSANERSVFSWAINCSCDKERNLMVLLMSYELFAWQGVQLNDEPPHELWIIRVTRIAIES